MKKIKFILVLIITVIAYSGSLFAFNDNDVMNAMRDELKRSMSQLKLESIDKPYYIEYTLHVLNTNDMDATLGALKSSDSSKTARITVGVRIGNYKFDNTNFFDFSLNFFGSGDDEEDFKMRMIPIESDYNTLRRELWLATDAAYKQTAEIMSKKEAALKNKVRKDTTPDFIKLEPKQYNFKKDAPALETVKWENFLRKASAVFRNYPEINISHINFEYNPETTYYINSEGRKYIKTDLFAGFEVTAASQSSDGMPVADMYSAYGNTPSELPSGDSLMNAVKLVADRLKSQIIAPYLEEPYSGPVIFEGQAAAEIFAQVFAPNLVTQREPLTESGSFGSDEKNMAFQQKIGGRVLPEFLSLSAIPDKSKIDNTVLVGHYVLDDDGVVPEDVNLVKDGYLKNLLSSRVPTRRVRNTNGHQRGGASMLSIIEMKSDKDHIKTSRDLKQRMLKLCKDRELPYGIIVKKVADQNMAMTSLYRLTSGDFPLPFGNSKKALLEVYRVYPDGHEELVRGCQAKGISVQSFKDIINTGNSNYVLNYLAPAVTSPFMTGGSQYIPATMIVPDLLFEDAEIVPIDEDFPKPPLYASPVK